MSKQAEAARAQAAVPDLQLRQRNTAEVLTGAQAIVELEDGYRMKYPATGAWTRKLETFQTAWRKSCPEMTFEIRSEGGAQWLEIRGPEGTKLFVEGARYMLTSHINPPQSFKHRVQHAVRYATGPLRVLPDFLVIGAKKCGTTALYSYLTQHPKIAPAFKKEIYYFNAGYGKGRNWYRSFFPTVFERWFAGGPLLTGEATPDYLFQPASIQRVRETIPNVRLIAILRNPVDRAYSFYNHNLRAGLEKLSFDEAIDAEEERLAGDRAAREADPRHVPFHILHHSYKSRGIYVDQLAQWADAFDRSQLCVLKTENLYEQPEATLREAFEFLGLDYHAPREFRKLNTAPYPDMDPAVRAKLEAYFEPHNRRLYDFLGTDLAW